MKLQRLTVGRMPGFRHRGFSLDSLGEGINVIWGPNGSGKTSACFAIRRLLWPNHPSVRDMRPMILSSLWSHEQQEYEIIVEESEYCTEATLQLAEIQNFPPHLYTIGIDDLFQAKDEDFAAAIAREIQGGYDLNILRAELVLSPRFGDHEHKEMQGHQEELANEIRWQQSIYDKEQTLAGLEERIGVAQKARENIALLDAAITFKERQDAYEEICKNIASFPSGIERVRIEDRKRLEDLQKKRAELRKDILLLPVREESKTNPDLCQNLIQELRLIESKIESAHQGWTQANVRKIHYCRDLKIDTETLETIDLSGIGDVLPLIKNFYEHTLRQKEIETKISMLNLEEQEPVTSFDLHRSQEGVTILAQWLHAAERFWTAASLVVAASMLGASVMAFLFAPLPIAIVTILGVCAAGLYSVLNPERKKLKQRYLSLGISSPSVWDESNVRIHMQGIENERAVYFLNQNNLQERQNLERLLQSCENAMQGDRDALVFWLHERGIEQLPDFSLLGTFLQQLKSAQEYCLAEKEHKALLYPLVQAKEALTRKIAEELGQELSHVVEMDSALATIRKRLQEKERRDLLLREMAYIEEQLHELLTRCGCQEESQFFDRYILLEAYNRDVALRAQLEGTLGELKRQLADASILAHEEKNVLEEKKKIFEAQATSYRLLIEEKTSIITTIASAQAGHRLEEKRNACQSASAQLEAKKAAFRSSILGQFLLNDIEESFKKEMRPEALKKGDVYFQQFTSSAYSIQGIDDAALPMTFLAYDCRQQSVRKLHELSRGTRLQLLLAIRLGFIAALEKGTKIPLILDEATSQADDERWHAIGHVLLQQAKEGRQILYFTCQRGACEAWRNMTTESSQLTFHDLTQRCEQTPYLAPVQRARWPLPLENEPLYDYSQRIQQPGLDFALPLNAQHVGHFLTTSKELHRLLLAGVSTYGQIQKMNENKSLHPFLKEQAAAATLAKGALLERFLSFYRVGRPPSIERRDVEDALQNGHLSDKFFPQFWELVQEKKGRGNHILEALDAKYIKGFRKDKIEELRMFFMEREKLDYRSPYTVDDMRASYWEAYSVHASAFDKVEAAYFLDYLLGLMGSPS